LKYKTAIGSKILAALRTLSENSEAMRNPTESAHLTNEGSLLFPEVAPVIYCALKAKYPLILRLFTDFRALAAQIKHVGPPDRNKYKS
jgi:hypothetical protein